MKDLGKLPRSFIVSSFISFSGGSVSRDKYRMYHSDCFASSKVGDVVAQNCWDCGRAGLQPGSRG